MFSTGSAFGPTNFSGTLVSALSLLENTFMPLMYFLAAARIRTTLMNKDVEQKGKINKNEAHLQNETRN